MIDEGEEFELTPERATPMRYGLAVLALISETSQAFANFCSSVTIVAARHVLQEQIDKEFQGIVKFNDDTGRLGAWGPEPKD